MTYAEYALEYFDKGYEPIPVATGAKTGIPAGATGRKGTVTRDKIEAWATDPAWQDENLGIRMKDNIIAIDVDAYGDKNGDVQLEELEFILGDLPATWSSTARGEDSPARQYFYEVPEGLNFLPKLSQDIDVVQRGHRYSVVYPSWHRLGTQYVWYTPDGDEYEGIPDPAEFERLPEAWVNYLVTPLVEDREGFSGTIEEWLETLPDAPPTPVVRKVIDELPLDNFTHDDVIRITYQLVRLGAEGHAGLRWAINSLYETWVSGEYASPEYVKELSTAISGAIEKAGAPVEPEGLPPYEDAIQAVPEHVLDQLIGEPLEKGQHKVLKAIANTEMGRDEALSVAWNAPTLKGAWSFDYLEKTFDSMRQEANAERGTDLEPARLEDEELPQVRLLSKTQRQMLKRRKPGIYDEYLEWCKKKAGPVWNRPYDEANAWAYLSQAFSSTGFIPVDNGTGGSETFLYLVNLGGTTSGKTKAMERMISAMNAITSEPTWNMGEPGSTNALIERLIDEDQRSVFMNIDEAHGWLQKMQKQDASSGIFAKLAEAYDGHVAAQQLKSLKEKSGKSSRPRLTMWLQGTPGDMYESLNVDMFKSGFLARVIWNIGDKRKIFDKPRKTKYLSGHEAVEGFVDPELTDMADKIDSARALIKRGDRRAPILPSEEAAKLLDEIQFKLETLVDEEHRSFDILSPSLTRLGENIRRAAALMAMSDARTTITVEDVLFAASHGEKWCKNLFEVARNVSSNMWQREVEEIWKFIDSKGVVSYTTVAARFDMYDPLARKTRIQSLIEKGWVVEKGEIGSKDHRYEAREVAL